ncbi:MAG: enoyl-CoA hydratase-related protein, partial [Candidatus Poseidoniales archaeon]|nr:enoyl-CoA hydratase-related protein [Candidatus Poseidoniales archaeon]
ILENSRWKAAEALAKGAVDEVVANGKLLDRAHAVAREWSKWSNHTKEATKHLVEVQSTQDFSSHLRHEQVLIMAASASENFKEGVQSFLEKREPHFK